MPPEQPQEGMAQMGAHLSHPSPWWESPGGHFLTGPQSPSEIGSSCPEDGGLPLFLSTSPSSPPLHALTAYLRACSWEPPNRDTGAVRMPGRPSQERQVSLEASGMT